MKYLVLLLSVWLFGCAANKTNETETIVATGTPEKRGDAKMVASMTAGVMFAYMGDLTGRAQDPIDYIMRDIEAPQPKMGDAYAAVLKSIESSQVTILDKDDSKIAVKAKSKTKEIYLQVVYFFSDGVFANYTINKH